MDNLAKSSINLRMADILLLLGSNELQFYFETDLSIIALSLNTVYEIHYMMWGSWNIAASASF